MRLESFDELDRKVKSGEYQLHAFPKGFVISTVHQYDMERALHIVLLSGEDFGSWKHEAMERLKQCAKANNCTLIETLCRNGLEKHLKALGWSRIAVGMRAKL